jgi:hypothetical protein
VTAAPGRTGVKQLTRALLDLTDTGRSTPCQSDPSLWFSVHAAERAEAAQACAWCPLLTACDTYAATNDERHGVWAGVDKELPAARCAHTGHPVPNRARHPART